MSDYFMSASDLVANATSPDYLIYELLPENSHGLLAGNTGSYKSFIALEMAHCISTGRPFMGKEIIKQGTVIYITGEGHNNLNKRLTALTERHGTSGNVLVKSNIDLSDFTTLAELQRAVEKVKPVLIIYDTLNSLSNGLDNNSSASVSKFLKSIINISDTVGAGTMIVHHFGKDSSRGMEGSHAFKSNSDHVFTTTKSSAPFTTTLKCDKQKDGEEFEPIQIEFEIVEIQNPNMIDVKGKRATTLLAKDFRSTKQKTAKDMVYSLIKDSDHPVTTQEVKDLLGDKFNYKYLSELTSKGLIVKGANRTYTIS